MTVREVNVPVKTVDAAVVELINTHNDKAEQARLRPSLQGWFVGQVMKATNGVFPLEVARTAVMKGLQ